MILASGEFQQLHPDNLVAVFSSVKSNSESECLNLGEVIDAGDKYLIFGNQLEFNFLLLDEIRKLHKHSSWSSMPHRTFEETIYHLIVG